MRKIDPNFPQYVHDNTRDEISHQDFINAYLTSKGAQSVNMEPFRTLQGSTATRVQQDIAAYEPDTC